MKNKILIVLMLLLIALICFVVWKLFLLDDIEINGKFEIKEIKENHKGEKLFLKHVTRGLDYSIIALSIDSNLAYNEISDYGFNTPEIFYKVENDTLFIRNYCKIDTPKKFQSKLPIKIIEMKENIEFIRFKKNYKKLGYNIFP